jgi:hypothetical protein
VDDIRQHSGEWHVQLGESPVHEPTVLGDLLAQLLHPQRDPSTVGRAIGPTSFLFPGMTTGRPRNAKASTSKLTRHGITALAARNSTRRALAADLPAAVIADLFGIHINTAVQWARQGQTDWTSYLAERPRSD